MDAMVPPSNVEAERHVLGAVLRDPACFDDVAAVVGADDFYLDAHRAVWGVFGWLRARGDPIDLVGCHARLRASASFGAGGAGELLAAAWDAVATAAAAGYHARLVRDAAVLRRLIHAATEILRDAYNPVDSAAETVAAAERRVFALAAGVRDAGAEAVRSAAELVAEVCADIDARAANGTTLAGLATGYAALDDVLGGLRPGELVVVGARPSLGKTALALNILSNVATGGQSVLLFSLEMPGRDIGARLVSMHSRVPMHLFTRPQHLTAAHAEALAEQTNPRALAGAPIYVDATAGATAAHVASVCRREAVRTGVALVAIDYLQLMRPENPRDNKTQQVGTLALRVKELARELDVPVILLSQLSRASESENRRPQLSDLRDSGSIEQDADRVILLHRDAGLSTSEAVWPIEVLVRKNRNGPVGDLTLGYRRSIMRFENYVV